MTELPLASVDRLIRQAGAQRVSEDAAQAMAVELERIGGEIAQKAAQLATHAKRKTVTADDVRLAAKS